MCCIQTKLLKCLCVSGGDEPREAQLGTPQRGPPRPDHSGRHAQPRQDQAPAGHQRGQETSRARCEYQSCSMDFYLLYWWKSRAWLDECFAVLVCMEGGRGLSAQEVCVFVPFLCVPVCMREYV